MGMRFCKSFGSKHFRITLSKSGVGYSGGVKGARITRTASGRTRKTASIPGSGISYTTESGARTHRRARTNEECGLAYEGLRGLARIIFIAAAAVIIPLSLLLLFANPLFTLFFLPVGCIFAFAARRFRRNA